MKERKPSKTPHIKSWPARQWESEEERKFFFAKCEVPYTTPPKTTQRICEDWIKDIELRVSSPPPAPDRPTRDSSRKFFPKEPNRLWQGILGLIDYLNNKTGAKKKKNSRPMTSIEDLFEKE